MEEFKLLIDNSMAKIITPLSKELYSDLRKRLSYLPADYYFRQANSKWKSDGRVYLIKGSLFDIGLLSKVKEFCKDHDLQLVTEFINTGAIKNPIEFMPPTFKSKESFKLRLYQLEAVESIIREKRGLVKAPTGSGKSLIMATALKEINQYPALVCLMSTDLLDQTIKHYEDYLGVPIGRIANGKFDIKPITVAMIQSLNSAIGKKDASVLRYLASVKVLFIDEAHHISATSVRKVSYKCQQANYKAGFSCTPFRDANDDIVIEAATGPIIYDISFDKLIELGFLVKPRIYFFHLPKMKISDKITPTYADIISDYVEGSIERNQIIADLAKCLYDEGRIVLILVNRIEHGDLLQSLIPGSYFVHGNTPREERNTLLTAFKKGQIKIMICTSIADEGFDAPLTSGILLAHPYKSLVKAYQRIGRGLRIAPGKQDVIIVDFYDTKVKYLKDHAKRRMQLYQSEKSFEIIESKLEVK